MQPTYSETYGWTVPCGCSPQWAGTYYTINRCDDCGGRGFHELTDDEAEELLAPTVHVVLTPSRQAALDAALAKINAAFGVSA